MKLELALDVEWSYWTCVTGVVWGTSVRDRRAGSLRSVEWAPKCGTVHEIAGRTLCENPYPPAGKQSSSPSGDFHSFSQKIHLAQHLLLSFRCVLSMNCCIMTRCLMILSIEVLSTRIRSGFIYLFNIICWMIKYHCYWSLIRIKTIFYHYYHYTHI